MPSDSQKPPLDEVMIAMDVVDTLRHRKLLVDRELNSDDREEKLIERLRELYASQGIDVPDSVLAEGVNALEQDRFSYKPPESGLSVKLAHAYINRGKWGRRLGIGLLVLLAVGIGYHFLVTAPQQRQLDQQVTELNAEMKTLSSEIETVDQEINLLQQELETISAGASGNLDAMQQQAHRNAGQAIAKAREYLDSARELGTGLSIDSNNFKSEVSAITNNLARQQELIGNAKSSLSEAQTAVDTIQVMADLPGALSAERDAVFQIARVDEAKQRAESIYNDSLAALRAGDVSTARTSYAMLRDLRQQLAVSYRLQIVSRPDEYSGLWRIPEANPDARNYYLVVEALGADGIPLTLPQLNEEDGQIYEVNKWALRVSEFQFTQVSADKQDDGIIQDRVVGTKQAGFLEPEYSIQTTGETITSW